MMRVSGWLDHNIENLVNDKNMCYKEKMKYHDKMMTVAERVILQRRHKLRKKQILKLKTFIRPENTTIYKIKDDFVENEIEHSINFYKNTKIRKTKTHDRLMGC